MSEIQELKADIILAFTKNMAEKELSELFAKMIFRILKDND